MAKSDRRFGDIAVASCPVWLYPSLFGAKQKRLMSEPVIVQKSPIVQKVEPVRTGGAGQKANRSVTDLTRALGSAQERLKSRRYRWLPGVPANTPEKCPSGMELVRPFSRRGN